jgi:hypothetical protein
MSVELNFLFQFLSPTFLRIYYFSSHMPHPPKMFYFNSVILIIFGEGKGL